MPIYESDHVIVTSDLRSTEDVIICLSYFMEGRPQGKPFGDGFIQSLGYSGIFVIAKRINWWQLPDGREMCAAIRRAAAPYKGRIAYGTSMGGYGSLMHGRDMGCTRIVAFSPQTSLNGPMLKEWREALEQYPVVRDCVEQDLGELIPEIVVDPYSHLDRPHFDRLRRVHPVQPIYYPFAGHKIFQTLKECGILGWSVERILKGATSELRGPYRLNRHRSANFWYNLGLTHIRRSRPDVVFRCLDRVVAIGNEKLARRLTRFAHQAQGNDQAIPETAVPASDPGQASDK